MFILTCLSTRSIAHSIPLHQHLTTCHSYRPEHFLKTISLSRVSTHFLIFFGINFSGSQTSQSFLSLTLESKMLRKTNSIGLSKNALYVKKVQVDDADECFMLSNVDKIGLSMLQAPKQVLCWLFSCRKSWWSENSLRGGLSVEAHISGKTEGLIRHPFRFCTGLVLGSSLLYITAPQGPQRVVMPQLLLIAHVTRVNDKL